jgi:hypothetical protein
MSNGQDDLGPPAISAHDLRMRMAEKELKKAQEALEKQKSKDKELEEFEEYFMTSEITLEDRKQIRAKVARLAESGTTELMIISFPSDFCTDGGRAINNFEPDWPDTLKGRARQIFELWEKNAKPLGFKLEARVLNYPDGIIGDIGLFVSW